MIEDSNPSAEGLDALRQRFQEHSRKAQAYYAIMHEAKEAVGDDAAANAWMNEAVTTFGGKTPAQMVNEGREEEVLAYVSSLKA